MSMRNWTTTLMNSLDSLSRFWRAYSISSATFLWVVKYMALDWSQFFSYSKFSRFLF